VAGSSPVSQGIEKLRPNSPEVMANGRRNSHEDTKAQRKMKVEKYN
jgi:hypothetical protein